MKILLFILLVIASIYTINAERELKKLCAQRDAAIEMCRNLYLQRGWDEKRLEDHLENRVEGLLRERIVEAHKERIKAKSAGRGR